MRVAVTGSSGLIGGAVVAALRADGCPVTRLVRQTPSAPDELAWDPLSATGGLDPGALEGVTAVVHLAGAGVADRRWTPQYQADIRNSRICGTRALVTALASMKSPPAVLVSGSAIGWYGDTSGREVDESSAAGSGFLADLVRDWESEALAAERAGVRVVTMRTGIVVSRRGGMLAKLLPVFRAGVGGRLGSGAQVMSWIWLGDLTAVVRFLLGQDGISGPVNATAPNPVTNAEMTHILASAVHRPALMTVPAPVLRIAVGGVSTDLLSSARVLPRRLLSAGYQYQQPELAGALAAELADRAH